MAARVRTTGVPCTRCRHRASQGFRQSPQHLGIRGSAPQPLLHRLDGAIEDRQVHLFQQAPDDPRRVASGNCLLQVSVQPLQLLPDGPQHPGVLRLRRRSRHLGASVSGQPVSGSGHSSYLDPAVLDPGKEPAVHRRDPRQQAGRPGRNPQGHRLIGKEPQSSGTAHWARRAPPNSTFSCLKHLVDFM